MLKQHRQLTNFKRLVYIAMPEGSPDLFHLSDDSDEAMGLRSDTDEDNTSTKPEENTRTHDNTSTPADIPTADEPDVSASDLGPDVSAGPSDHAPDEAASSTDFQAAADYKPSTRIGELYTILWDTQFLHIYGNRGLRRRKALPSHLQYPRARLYI